MPGTARSAAHAGGERADAGQHDTVGLRDHGRIAVTDVSAAPAARSALATEWRLPAP
jgi:hypothetical protein